MIAETYQQYLRLRNTSLPIEEQQRLTLKAQLARDITDGNGDWYKRRLAHHAYGMAPTYGHIAASLSDTVFAAKRREPSLAEAVLATEALQRDYETLEKELLPYSRAIVQVGSTSWAKNYDVRLDPTNPSDLDIELLVDDLRLTELVQIPYLTKDINAFLPYFYENQADYLASHLNRDGRPISIHVMPTSVFVNNCQKDYFTQPKEHRLAEFRTKPKSKPPVYVQHNHVGKPYEIPCSTTSCMSGQITNVPLMYAGVDNELVMGLVMDKYFTYPQVCGDLEFFTQNTDHFKKNLAAHLKGTDGKFSGFPSRRNRMPQWILDKLDSEQRSLV